MNRTDESKEQPVSASDYILENFEPSDRIAVLVRSRTSGQTIQRITTARNASSQEFQKWLQHKNLDSDVYIGMNALRPDAQSRTKEDIATIRHLYLDIDRNGPSALKSIDNSGLVPHPNFVLESSPEKYQVIWKVEGIGQDQAEALQRAMVREFGGDPAAIDSTRVLRLPEFANRKYETEFVVKAHRSATETYHVEDFRLRTDPHDDDREDRPRESRPLNTRDNITQSERDWAFAKRALARGDDPEEIIRRIEDYRGDEKHPNYARHTVERAAKIVGEIGLGKQGTHRQAEIGRNPILQRSKLRPPL